jgi:toxin ParE1/3/4
MPREHSRIIWAPAAKRDLRDIWYYFVDVASREVADRLLRDIIQTSERIRQRPQAGRTRDEVLPGLRSVLVHPYVLFYRVNSTAIEVVRVVHQRRNFAAVFSKPKG